MPDSIDDLPREIEVVPPKSVVIASTLNGKAVYTHCPPGTTLEKAKAVYLPKGAKKPKLLSEKEVAKKFPEEG